MRRKLSRVLAFASAIAGCTPPPPPPPTVVNLALAASADVNPTASGLAAPLELRVYQLASESGFSNAGFFSCTTRTARR